MSRSVRQRSRGLGASNRLSQEPPTRHDRSANFSFSSIQVGTTSSNEANAFASARLHPEQQGHVLNPRSPFAPAYQTSRTNGRLSPQPPRSPRRTPLSPATSQSQQPRTTIALAPPPFDRARSGSPYAPEGHPAHLAPRRHLSFEDLERGDPDRMPSTSASHHLKSPATGKHLKSPDAESSYSFSAEDEEYKRMAAEAERKKMSLSTSRKARRSSRNKSDDAMYLPGDDDSADSDDNPDFNDGLARGMSHRVSDRRGHLQHADDISFRRRRPSVVPEDEGVASETDSAELEKDDHRARSRSVASPTPHLPTQIIHVVDDSLPSFGTNEWADPRSTLRQAADKLHDAGRSLRRFDKSKLAGLAFALALAWCLYLYSRSARAGGDGLAKPANFDEMAGRLRGMESRYADAEKASASKWSAFEHRLNDLEVGHYKVAELAKQQATLNTDIRRTKEQMTAMTGRMASLEGRVSNLEGKVSKAVYDGSLTEALDKILPSRMPFVKNSKGEWTIPDSFFVDFKRLLFGSGELEETIRRMLNEGVETQRKTWQAEVTHDTEVLEAMLQTLFDKRLEPEVQGYLDRSTFIKSLEGKLADLRREIRHVQDHGSAALSKLKIGSKNSQDMHDVVAGIVDAMLLKYSKDKTGLADYALFSAGARIIEETTSPSLELSRPSLFRRVGFGQKPVHGKVPQVALHPDTSVGQCWAFAGPQGDLGVLLSHSNVVVSAVTIDHVSMDLAPDVTSAPKDIEVWATLEGEDNFAKARKYLEVSPYIDEPTSMPQTEQNVLLTKVTYDIHSAQATQTFPIPDAFVDLGIDTRAVTFRVQSNWGSDVTCLYRVRVHGKQAAVASDQD